MADASCIGCRRKDHEIDIDDAHWVAVDYLLKIGICSDCGSDHMLNKLRCQISEKEGK